MIRRYRIGPALLALHLSGVVIAWFAPDDALTRWPLLKIAVTNVGEIFPLLPEAVKKSKFHDVTALYFLLMLVAVPMRFSPLCGTDQRRFPLAHFPLELPLIDRRHVDGDRFDHSATPSGDPAEKIESFLLPTS